MPEFTGWIEYEDEDQNLFNKDELVRVLYRNGHIETGLVWEISWDQVSEYQREILA